jgi:type VI secretion system secreted protein VgrG
MPPNPDALFLFRAGELTDRDLLVASFEIHEAISQLPHARLLLTSEDHNIDAAAIVGQRAVLTVHLRKEEHGQGHPDDPSVARYFNGIVKRFEHVAHGAKLSHYEAEIVPFVWLLTLQRNCRIFQENATTENIIKQVFKDAGMTDDMFRVAFSGSYKAREFCVQYNESDWDFLQRLMEQDGIFYFFDHSEMDHELVIADSKEVHESIFGEEKVPFEAASGMIETEHVHSFRMGQEIRSDVVRMLDYMFRKPSTPAKGEAKTEKPLPLEHFEFPGAYSGPEGRIDDITNHVSEMRLGEFQATRVLGEGKSICRRLKAGRTFTMTGRFSGETEGRELLITRILTRGDQPQAAGPAGGVGETKTLADYGNEFLCIPADVQFRPPRLTPKPVVHGVQNAIVVGPSGEEIYTDEFGRIKVHFPWDREGVFDEKASCWVPVSQGWAGGAYGMMFLPRVGQEVLVSFLEGDPDMPVVTGRTFNGDHKPPYKLPDNKTRSTILTNSSTDGSGANELRFEDKKGAEHVFLHSQLDLHVRANNDRFTYVGYDGKGSSHETIEKEFRQLVKDNYSVKIEKAQAIDVGGDRSVTVGGTKHEKISSDLKCEASGGIYFKAGGAIVLDGGGGVTMKCGGNYVNVSSSGVGIKGASAVIIQGAVVMINSGSPPPGGSASAPKPASAAEPEEPFSVKPGADKDYTGKKKPPEPKPIPKLKEQSWIKISLKDKQGNPGAGEPYLVIDSGGREIRGRLDVNGEAHVGGLKEGAAEISYPSLDVDEWE